MAAETVAPLQKLPTSATFLVAGMSGISAWLFIHPFDVVKVRMQLMGSAGAGSGAVSAAREVVKSQGIRYTCTCLANTVFTAPCNCTKS
jgi:solute carrier family 25 (mitochondrial oxoglutarate transporter), member 11